MSLSCASAYTGTFCETLVTAAPTVAPTTTVAPYGFVASTVAPQTRFPSTFFPRCNFTIGLKNDGAFTTRFRIKYSIDNIQQPIYVSREMAFVGEVTRVTLPWYVTNLVVSLEALGFSWYLVHADTYINTLNYCTKCYKVWGDVSNPRWDYIDC